MPKRRTHESKKVGTIDDLVEEVSHAQLDTEDAMSNLNVPLKPESRMDIITAKRNELIQASTDDHITQKVEYLKWASNRVIEKIHKQLEAQQQKEVDAFLTDLAISHFASMLGGLDAIESPESLIEELKANKLLRKDVESIISTASPYIPLIGLASGVAITGKHIYQHKSTPPPSPSIPPPSTPPSSTSPPSSTKDVCSSE